MYRMKLPIQLSLNQIVAVAASAVALKCSCLILKEHGAALMVLKGK